MIVIAATGAMNGAEWPTTSVAMNHATPAATAASATDRPRSRNR
jgi:alkaline phosphatase